MSHAKEADVLELRGQGKKLREITALTGVPRSTVSDILKGAPRPRPEIRKPEEPPPGRKSDMTIKVTNEKWAVEISGWVKLIHEAAVDQIPRCKEIPTLTAWM